MLFSLDHWTSPNHHAFCGVLGHWISATGDLVTVLLGMERFSGTHPGANQAQIIWKLLEQYRLRHKVGYFTTNKETNNDTAWNELGKMFRNGNVAFDQVSTSLWRFGHLINLIVKAFL